jgi:glycosyltransferase involved in cell wall biosynthesis
MRVANVIDGLLRVGDLHVCVVDTTPVGQQFAADVPYDTSVVRAAGLSSTAKLLRLGGWTVPTRLRYAGAAALRARILAEVGPEWDLVWCSRLGLHVLVGDTINGRRIVDFDDLGDRLLRSQMRDRRGRLGVLRTLPRNVWDRLDIVRWSRLQRRVARTVDRVVVCSPTDSAHVGSPNVVVVPNGYPAPTGASPEHSSPAPPCLLFVGPLYYESNRLAVQWFVDEVLPLIAAAVPDVLFLVVGEATDVSLSGDLSRVELTGWVRDVQAAFARASVVVAPLHSGGGTPLKVVEALARGVPLVSTSFACAGIGLTDGEEVLIADEPTHFARCCIALLRDPERGRDLAARGLLRYARDYTAERSSSAAADATAAVLGLPVADPSPGRRT